jgi:hypothetical protein
MYGFVTDFASQMRRDIVFDQCPQIWMRRSRRVRCRLSGGVQEGIKGSGVVGSEIVGDKYGQRHVYFASAMVEVTRRT